MNKYIHLCMYIQCFFLISLYLSVSRDGWISHNEHLFLNSIYPHLTLTLILPTRKDAIFKSKYCVHRIFDWIHANFYWNGFWLKFWILIILLRMNVKFIAQNNDRMHYSSVSWIDHYSNSPFRKKYSFLSLRCFSSACQLYGIFVPKYLPFFHFYGELMCVTKYKNWIKFRLSLLNSRHSEFISMSIF